MVADWLSSVHHDGSPKYVSQLHPKLGQTVHLRLRADVRAPIKRVFLRTCSEGEQALAPMQSGPLRPPVRWFEGDLVVRDPTTHYRFVIEAEDGVWWYTAAGAAPFNPLDHSDFRIVADAPPMAWLRSTVFYQVFVDRFANGDPSRDPSPEEYDYPRYPYKKYEYENRRPRTFPWEAAPPDDQSFPLVFYGGDLPGLIERLDHVADLGANALYLNPVFTSPSNHRYDIADYGHVDPHLGGDDALIQLREALTKRGMRYVLDIELRHLSYWHPWFQAALENAGGKEANFFSFSRHPEEYHKWLGVWSLPVLDYRSAELRSRMITGANAVLRRWLRPPYAADGWGVNLPDRVARPGEPELGFEIGATMRRAIKETQPEAYFVTRNVTDVTAQLQGDQLDGLTDFASFTFPLLHWLRPYREEAYGVKEAIAGPPWSTTALEAAWRTGRAAIPWSVTLNQFTQLDNQDTPRIRTIVGGNDALHRLAVVVQFTYPGVPGLFYGDEIGMEDVPRLSQRGCMVWDERRWNKDLHAFYRNVIGLRRSLPALQEGGFQMLAVEREGFAFQREGKEGRVIVVAHRGARPRPAGRLPVAHGGVADGTKFVEHFSGETATVQRGALPLPSLPQGATIWIAEEPAAASPPPHPASRPPRRRDSGDQPRARTRAPRCPVCGRQDGSRLEKRLTLRGDERDQRWVCLWCGATWSRSIP
jgi:alpha-glucosidase